MRLWHQKLIPYLDRQRLLGQHRECCALRGKGWGRKHSVVDYVFTYSPAHLYAYHLLIMKEMRRRGYKPDSTWSNISYRGATLGYDKEWLDYDSFSQRLFRAASEDKDFIIYNEHNSSYLKECIDNLKEKGVEINYGKK